MFISIGIHGELWRVRSSSLINVLNNLLCNLGCEVVSNESYQVAFVIDGHGEGGHL